jgi:hypothetical protein
MIEHFISAISLAKSALSLIKDAKDVLPEPARAAVTNAVNQAEVSFKIAEAQAAHALSFGVCQCAWPPQIALLEPGGIRRCPKCRRDVDDMCWKLPNG